MIRDYWEAGVRHIVALRGASAGLAGRRLPAPRRRLRNATELTRGIKAIAPFEVTVGLYPQVHPESRPSTMTSMS